MRLMLNGNITLQCDRAPGTLLFNRAPGALDTAFKISDFNKTVRIITFQTNQTVYYLSVHDY